MSGERTIAIGDIHGCDVALETLLAAIEPSPEDTVVVLGDLCDRGPGTCRVIDMLLDLSQYCDLKVIRGNHDEMMLGVFGRGRPYDLAFWWGVGGSETLESYGGDPGRVPERHLDFLEASLPYHEIDSTIFVHASLEPGVSLEEQDGDWLRWRKITGREPPHSSGRRIVCGHTSQRSGRPLVWNGWACIDTRVFDDVKGGWLTALVVETDEVFQANQQGQHRGPFPLTSETP